MSSVPLFQKPIIRRVKIEKPKTKLTDLSGLITTNKARREVDSYLEAYFNREPYIDMSLEQVTPKFIAPDQSLASLVTSLLSEQNKKKQAETNALLNSKSDETMRTELEAFTKQADEDRKKRQAESDRVVDAFIEQRMEAEEDQLKPVVEKAMGTAAEGGVEETKEEELPNTPPQQKKGRRKPVVASTPEEAFVTPQTSAKARKASVEEWLKRVKALVEKELRRELTKAETSSLKRSVESRMGATESDLTVEDVAELVESFKLEEAMKELPKPAKLSAKKSRSGKSRP